LEALELCCRLTRIAERGHLRASHIKPWCRSDDREKLDPNNGLLLSPHIDHLFDRGYISFTDDGDLMISSRLDISVLAGWGVSTTVDVGAFTTAQRTYLAYHRQNVFMK
jgi:putative restriction endonuclease